VIRQPAQVAHGIRPGVRVLRVINEVGQHGAEHQPVLRGVAIQGGRSSMASMGCCVEFERHRGLGVHSHARGGTPA
jgi:hypothetical protein